MEIKQTLITAPKSDSRPNSKRVQFSRSRTDIDHDNRDDFRQTKSATTRSKRSRSLFSDGKSGSSTYETGRSSQQSMMLRLALKSRDSRRSRDETKYLSPETDYFLYRRGNSCRSYESSVSLARKERDAKLRFKLQLWTHVLVYFQKLHQKIIRNNQELEAYKKQMDYTEGNFVSSEDSNSHEGLDMDYFKPVTKIRMSKEAKRILLKDPDARTPEEIKHVKTDLMVTKTESIQTLPEDCQIRLAKNVGLESLGPKRFIIKEGYAAEYCYLIIVGSVIRAYLDEGAIRAVSDDKPLKEGQLFGEDEMKSSSPRKASYISASYTEILRVSAEDYYDIFMAGHNVRNDDIQLLRQIDVFDGWNLEKIQDDRDKIKRKYFPNNWIVHENDYNYEESENRKPQDSRTFEWIYVVKSGSLQIMKLFDRVKPTINMTTGNYVDKIHTDGYLAFLTKGAEFERFTASHTSKSSRPITPSTSTSSHDIRAAPLLNRLTRLLRPHTTGNEQRFINTPESLRNKQVPKSAISSKLISIPKKRRQSTNSRREQATPSDTSEARREDSTLTEDLIYSSEKEGFDSRLEKTSSSLTDYEHRMSPTRKKQVTIESRDRRCKSTDVDDPVVCKIKTLTKGDVFGLEYIVFDVMDEKHQPGFILKSNGSECLMIHKKVYKDLIKDNFDLKEKLRSDVSPYPEDDDLKGNLLVRTNWEVHKDILLRNIMIEKAKVRPQKHGAKFAPIRLK